mgnify:CR=1 FL=1
MKTPAVDPINQYTVAGGETTFAYDWKINTEQEITVLNGENNDS